MLSVFQLILTLWQTAAQASGSAAACLNRRRRAEPGRRLLARQWEAVSPDAFLQFKATAPQSGSETASPPEPRRPSPPRSSSFNFLPLLLSGLISDNAKEGKKKKRLRSQRLPLTGITPPPPPPPAHPSESAVRMPAPYAALWFRRRYEYWGRQLWGRRAKPRCSVPILAASERPASGGGEGRKLGAGNKSGKRSVCAINPPRVQAPQLIISDGLFASQTMRCDFQPHELGGRAKK